jgi:hypothetical protein
MHLLAPAALLCVSLLVAESLLSASVGAAAPIPSALGLVALAILTSMLATRPTLSALLFGAAAAVLYALLRPLAPWAAGAAYLALVLAPRTLRSITTGGGVVATALGLAMGALGAMTIAASLHASPERLVGALFLVASFVALPLTVPADDVRSAALRSVAAESRGTARQVLLRAIAMRRRLERALHRPSKDEQRALDAAFARLSELGEARTVALAGGVELEHAMRSKLEAIVGCVRALDRRAASHDRLDASADQRLVERRADVENEVRVLADLDH